MHCCPVLEAASGQMPSIEFWYSASQVALCNSELLIGGWMVCRSAAWRTPTSNGQRLPPRLPTWLRVPAAERPTPGTFTFCWVALVVLCFLPDAAVPSSCFGGAQNLCECSGFCFASQSSFNQCHVNLHEKARTHSYAIRCHIIVDVCATFLPHIRVGVQHRASTPSQITRCQGCPALETFR